jgi:two-component system, cell cycle sensor histidine kinase and response regulator CckA
MNQLLRRTIGSDVDLRTECEGDKSCIRGDESRIEQVLLNLAINARDAMPRGGTLTVRTAPVDLDESFCKTRTGVKPGEYVLLSVKDTGCGIPREILPLVFEPFFTTKEAGKGTGLGLSTVYGVPKQFGGHIEINTREGQGTEVMLYFPRVPATPELLERRKTEVVGGHETILIVDDEDSLRLLSRRILEGLGYRTVEATNGEEALAVFSTFPRPIDLVLTDVIMPKMGGPELAQRLREAGRKFALLYMSGFVGSATNGELINARGASMLNKPYTREELACAVRTALDEAALKNPAVTELG